MLGLAAITGAVFAACAGPVNGTLGTRSIPGGDRDQGRALIASYGCGSCHEINGIPGADARVAPPLDDFYDRTYIAGTLPNTWENLTLWIQDPQGIEPDTAMPDQDISEEEARHIAAYLYDPPHWPWLTGE